jgi:hypothetical protein
MYTQSVVGLAHEDAETRFYYASLPAKPKVGQTLRYEETGNRYLIVGVDGEPLTGDSEFDDQRTLAWTEVAQGKKVPSIFVQQLQ